MNPAVLQIDTDKPFKSQLGVRGAFSNSGSRDVGPDRSDSPAPGKGASLMATSLGVRRFPY